MNQNVLELVQESQNWSNEAWVDFEEDFHGIVIKNMSLYHLMMLDGVGSPFLKKEKMATDIDICLFLWIVSSEYSQDEKARNKFFKKVTKITNVQAVQFIENYIERTFSESETMNMGEKGQTYFLTYFVDLFAREYGWSLQEILKTPLRIAFQLITAINERNAKKAGEKYVRNTEIDNQLHRYILKGNSDNGI